MYFTQVLDNCYPSNLFFIGKNKIGETKCNPGDFESIQRNFRISCNTYLVLFGTPIVSKNKIGQGDPNPAILERSRFNTDSG